MKNTSTKKAMSQLGSIGGKALVKRHGKKYMRDLVKRYWDSPAGKMRRRVAKARATGRELSNLK